MWRIHATNFLAMFEQLLTLLQSQNARFRVIPHPPEGKSELVAQIRGTLPGQGAKAMLCKNREGSDQFYLAVLSGDRKLDFKKLAQAVQIKKATLASPEEAMQATGCVIGAIPPFSFSPAITLVVDPDLVEQYDEIAFNAGRLDHSMVLNAQDYVRIAQPLISPLSA